MLKKQNKLARLLKNFIFSGLDENNTDIETLRQVGMLNALIVVSLIILFPLSIIALKQQLYQLLFVETLVSISLISIVIFMRKTSDYCKVSIPTVVIAGIFYAYLLTTGGKANTGFIWMFSYPSIATFLLGIRKGIFFSFLLFIYSLAIMFAEQNIVPTTANYTFSLSVRISFSYLLICLFAWAVESTRATAQFEYHQINDELQDSCKELEKRHHAKKEIITELREAIVEAEQLKRILPICSSCKKVRNDTGYWEKVERYFNQHSGTKFSHSVCPDCANIYYKDILDDEENGSARKIV
ncbi:MAG: hypothetical protein ACQETH_08850 [Candidatus Rifleibacteriota bacterium]